MILKWIHVKAMVLAIAMPCLLAAQSTQPSSRPAGLFDRLDRNGDGYVTRDECPPRLAGRFQQFDLNGDGRISRAEGIQALLAAGRPEVQQPDTPSDPDLSSTLSFAPLPADIEEQSDIVYKTVGNQKLTLDLYRVKGRKYDKAPLVIYIHGGGYVKGSKDGVVRRYQDLFLPLLKDHGFQAASLNYRLCTKEGPKLIDCSTDCKDAVRFLAKNSAAYGIDPSRIASIGASAGGSLSLILPLTKNSDLPGDPELAKYPAAVRCAVSWFGCTDFTKMSQGLEAKHPDLFKTVPDADVQQYQIVSPVYYMQHSTEKTPILLVHGDSDPVVPQAQSIWMNLEAKRIGFPVEFVSVKNARHGFQDSGKGPVSPTIPEIHKLTLDFILKNCG